MLVYSLQEKLFPKNPPTTAGGFFRTEAGFFPLCREY
jgi:hypothetical protein